MRDTIKLQIGNKEISSFLSYDVDSDVLTPADAFNVRLSRIDNSIKEGSEFKLYVNDDLEMAGIIDSIACSYSKGSQEMSIVGRDHMGLLIDSSVEEWKTIENINLKDLATRLLKNVPYINKSVLYDSRDTSTFKCQFEPGTSVFNALSDYSNRQGLIMWMDPDGTLVFGQLKDALDCESPDYSFYCYKDAENRQKNNIISADNSRNISGMYSKIMTVAQVQGSDDRNVGEHTITKTATNESFPFTKPLVMQANSGSESGAEDQAKWEMKRRNIAGWEMNITTAGHSQNRKNYRANRVCYIKDEILGLDGSYLILGRKFTLDRTNGPRTVLKIGPLVDGYTVN